MYITYRLPLLVDDDSHLIGILSINKYEDILVIYIYLYLYICNTPMFQPVSTMGFKDYIHMFMGILLEF